MSTDATEALREKLCAAVEALNSSNDPWERIDLHLEVTRLRRLLRQGGAQ